MKADESRLTTSDRFVVVALAIELVISKGRNVERALAVVAERHEIDSKARAWLFESLRWGHRSDYLLNLLLSKPLKPSASALRALLLLCIYLLEKGDMGSHAVVNEAGNAVRRLSAGWAVGLVNGVLRNFVRRQAEFSESVLADPAICYSHPRWMVKRLRKDWPDNWQTILEANNKPAPMTLRVNSQKSAPEQYLNMVESQGVDWSGSTINWASSALVLSRPIQVAQIPTFEQGGVSVQGLSAQLCAPLMQLEPGQEVLDACAAPGNKTCHLLETEPTLVLTAIEVKAERAKQIHKNLARLALEAKVIVADVVAWAKSYDGPQFDRILVDVPCSGTGVIRRHADIKWLRRESDLVNLARLQGQILRACCAILAPSGVLLYATCSVLEQENDAQIASLVQGDASLKSLPFDLAVGAATAHGWQIVTGDTDLDGFYLARIRKSSSA